MKRASKAKPPRPEERGEQVPVENDSKIDKIQVEDAIWRRMLLQCCIGWFFLIAGAIGFASGLVPLPSGKHRSPTIEARTQTETETTGDGRPMVFGFLPDYRFEALAYDFVVPRVTHLCLFGSEADPQTGKLITRLPSESKWKDIRRLAKASNTTLIIGLGGDGRSEFFPSVLGNKERFATFVKELRDVCSKYGLRGVELNWMYPRNMDDISNLHSLVRALRRTGLAVSMAIPHNDQFAKAIASIEFDIVHVMVYQTGVPTSPEQSLRIMDGISKHIPAPRLTLGIPFYGLDKSNRNAISYEDIVRGDAKRFAYESRHILKEKSLLAKEYHYAGVSIWELGQDCRPYQVGSHEQTCPDGRGDSLLNSFLD